MYPYITIGAWHLGTFGLLLWLAAVCATWVLYRSFQRDGVDADALNVVALVVICGVLGAKLWHELQTPAELMAAMKQIFAPGWSAPLKVLMGFLTWFQAGFAWFGGMLAGIAMLMWQGVDNKPNGMRGFRAGVRMLDLATAAALVGYAVGRLGCLTSGDGDYGLDTTSWMGVSLSPRALVPRPHGVKVLPTPLWEFVAALALAWVLWKLAERARPLGWLTAIYLILSGIERFIVEFWRINPRLYFGNHFSNAQVAALGSVVVGAIILIVQRGKPAVGGPVGKPIVEPVTVAEPAG
jgi:phosphatidylglycerol:prolipoprotein diacylglycerol transferase